MTDRLPTKSRRSIVARRTLTLGTTIATAALGSAAFATPITARPDDLHNSPVHLVQQSTQDNGVALAAKVKALCQKTRKWSSCAIWAALKAT